MTHPRLPDRNDRELVAAMRKQVALAVTRTGATRAIAAVSGGQDSMCLLDTLAQIRSVAILVCHVNHGLRPEADEDEHVVAKVAEAFGLPFVARSVDVRGLAEEEHLGIETAARRLRHDALRSVARENEAGAIVLGHTADDQIETVMMRLVRGAGTRALGGMRVWERPLLRPLLSRWRTETLTYCRVLQIPFSADPTNEEGGTLRNQIRLTIIPALEEASPGGKEALLRTSEILRRDGAYLDHMTQDALDATTGDGRMNPRLWAALSPALQWGTAKLELERGGGEVSFETIERRVGDLEAARISRNLSDAGDDEGRVIMDEPLTIPKSIRVPGVTQVDGIRVEAMILPLDADVWRRIMVCPRWQAYMDMGCGTHPQIRSWRPGDSIRSLGMEGARKKLQDVFVDAGIPKDQRRRVPLIVLGDEVVWATGLTLSRSVAVSEETKAVVWLRVTADAGPSPMPIG